MFQTIVIALLGLIVASLFSALLLLAHAKGHGERVARMLTLRISLSLLLFTVLMGSFFLGLIHPH